MKVEDRHLGVDEVASAYGRRGVRGALYLILPNSTYARLRGLRLSLQASALGRAAAVAGARVLALVSRSALLSGLHYALFSREMDREHRAVLAARAKHILDVNTGRGNLWMLRRNVHRLEKGLIMKPPRPVFGVSKIGETLGAFEVCLAQLEAGDETIRSSLEWARDVLDAYFARQATHVVINRARERFKIVRSRISVPAESAKQPYVRLNPGVLPTIDDLERLAKHRRSVRWYRESPVPREIIDRALALALQSPSACNRQPFRFEFFDQRDLVDLVGAIPKGTPGWLHQIPCFAVIVGRFDAFLFERDRHVPYIDGSLAAMSLIFALESQGVSSCCVNFPDFDETERRMAAALKLPPWERVIMCLAIGYADEKEPVLYSEKVPLAMARRYNFGSVL